jgi:hypothetical protein
VAHLLTRLWSGNIRLKVNQPYLCSDLKNDMDISFAEGMAICKCTGRDSSGRKFMRGNYTKNVQLQWFHHCQSFLRFSIFSF